MPPQDAKAQAVLQEQESYGWPHVSWNCSCAAETFFSFCAPVTLLDVCVPALATPKIRK